MKIVSLTDLKNNFSAIMDLVKRGGETVVIQERNIPIIKMAPIGSRETPLDASDGEALLLRLERAGLVRRGEFGKDQTGESLPVKAKKGANLLQALMRERSEGW